MSNITASVNELLQKKGAKTCTCFYNYDRINEFLKEAYQINRRVSELLEYLRSIRQPYLSNAPPPRRRHAEQHGNRDSQYLSDQQRDQIDAEAKSVLRDLYAAVSNLSRAEQVRQGAETAVSIQRWKRKGFGALGQWAAGGGAAEKSPQQELEEAKANSVKAHREGVIWYLQTRLEQCGMVQGSMMQTRLDREIEKSKSVLHKSRGAGPVPVWEDTLDQPVPGKGRPKSKPGFRQSALSGQDFDTSVVEAEPNDEQMQLLAQENKNMLKLYENKLDQVRAAEKSLIEISELQTTLATNLEIQSIHIDQLVQDSYSTTENVGAGNKELKRASERKSTAKMVCFATAGVCTFFVIWDFFI